MQYNHCTVDFFIIGFPNPVVTDHPANLSVHPDSEVKEDKINPPYLYILFIIIHDFSHVNIFFHFFFVGQHFISFPRIAWERRRDALRPVSESESEQDAEASGLALPRRSVVTRGISFSLMLN